MRWHSVGVPEGKQPLQIRRFALRIIIAPPQARTQARVVPSSQFGIKGESITHLWLDMLPINQAAAQRSAYATFRAAIWRFQRGCQT